MAAEASAFALEAVALEDGALVRVLTILRTFGNIVLVVLVVLVGGVVRRATVVVVAGAKVLVVGVRDINVVVGANASVAGVDEVNDITSTTNKTGLDHIRMCTLLEGEGVDIIRTEG